MGYDMKVQAARDTRKRKMKEWAEKDFEVGKYRKANKK